MATIGAQSMTQTGLNVVPVPVRVALTSCTHTQSLGMISIIRYIPVIVADATFGNGLAILLYITYYSNIAHPYIGLQDYGI